MRQIVLDTETTGLDPAQGHRVIEIGCVELENRRLTGRHYHVYLNPDREIDEAAVEVHGITSQFLADKPRFEEIAEEFLDFVRGAELIIHNAPFDVGFLNSEYTLLGSAMVGSLPACDCLMEKHCQVVDSLIMARTKHPGQRNSLDALCKRYEVDNSRRDLHGALLDAEILADVYLAMTGGQTRLSLGEEENVQNAAMPQRAIDEDRAPLRVIPADGDELKQHEKVLQSIDAASEGALWRRRPAAIA